MSELSNLEYVGSQPSLTYAGARRVLDAAVAKATDLGVAVNVSVCDASGHPVAFARMDGAALLAGSIATDKAYSVVAFLGLPTSAWDGMLELNSALRDGIVHRDRLVIFGGGIPVKVNGDVVGAVGVSGGSEAEDEEIATAGSGALA
jgi:glc operon protein GlcG